MYEGQSTSGFSGSNQLSAAPKNQSATERETIALHETASVLSKIVSILHERLQPILRQPLPATGTGENKEETLTAVANAVRQSRQLVQGSVFQLEDILQRLDI